MYNFKNKNYKIFGITSSKYQLCPTKVSNHLIKNRGRYRANTVFFLQNFFGWREKRRHLNFTRLNWVTSLFD